MSYKFILDSNKDLFIRVLGDLVIDLKVLESQDLITSEMVARIKQLETEIMTLLKETF